MDEDEALSFASGRQALVDELFATLRRSVRLALGRFPDETWYAALLARFRSTFRLQYLSEFDERLTETSVLNEVSESVESSLQQLTSVDEDIGAQADRIAEGLATAIANGVTEAHALQDGEAMVKTWVTMEDTSVRPAHAAVHLATVDVGEAFTVDGVPMSRPGDMSAPPSLWLNCRCILAVTEASRVAAGILSTGGTMDEDILTPFYGVLAPEGVPTTDGRRFAIGSMRWRDLPIPILWQKYTDDAHGGSVIVGLITELWREVETNLLRAKGHLLDIAEGREVETLMRSGALRGVSVDVYDATVEIQDLDGAKIEEDDLFDVLFDPDVEFLQTLVDGEIAGATLVAFPAFKEAFISLGEEPVAAEVEEFAISEKPWDGSASRFTPEQWYASTIIHLSDDRENKSDHKLPIKEPNGDLSRAGVHAAAARINQVDAPAEKIASAKATLRGAYKQLGEDPPEVIEAAAEGLVAAAPWTTVDWDGLEALTASSGVSLPPSEWFADPHLSGPTPLVITDDGQVFGHLATWGTCHIGIQNACVTPPHSKTDYQMFLTGARMTTGGEVPVGQITMGTGHARTSLRAAPAMAHYDNTGTAVADVMAGEDDHGIWVAGAMRSAVDPERIEELRASALSGDWRIAGGSLELVAALAVNVPGFPVPRTALAASGADGVQTSLVAAGIVDRSTFSVEDVREIARQVVQEMADEEAARAALAAIASERARAELDAVAALAGRK